MKSFRTFLKEAFFTYVKGTKGKLDSVYKNPTSADFNELRNKETNLRDNPDKEVRALIYKNDAYIWDPSYFNHEMMARQLRLNLHKCIALFLVVDGSGRFVFTITYSSKHWIDDGIFTVRELKDIVKNHPFYKNYKGPKSPVIKYDESL